MDYSAFGDHFERLITQHIMSPRYGWPSIPIERRRCTQSAALALALPAKLKNVAAVLELEQQKDESGHRVMMQMAKPRRPRQGEDPAGVYWFDDTERREQLYAYCKQDVATERALHAKIEGLTPEEQLLWGLDSTINDRGLHIDGKLLDAAINIAEAAEHAINTELQTITKGALETIHQTAKLVAWLADQDCVVTDVQKTTLKRVLTRKNMALAARRVLELRLDGAHAAAAKLTTMRAWRNGDGRARGTFRFHGASTGRWTSFGIQLQNLKRPLVEDMAAAIEAVGTGNLEHMRQRYPQPMSVVGDITRALICAAPGHRLIAADFSGVESRVTAWISGQQDKLDRWAKFDRTGDPNDEPYYILGKALGVAHEQARTIGKTADLAFGYMGGVGAWEKLAPDDDASTENEIKRRQQTWRNAHPQTVKFWGAVNRAAIQAVRKPGSVFECGRVAFKFDGTFLRMKLPSGRKLAYPFTKLRTDKYGSLAVVFMDNQQGKWTECRFGHGAYGGTWIENAVQAVARDLFAAAMPRLEAQDLGLVLALDDKSGAAVRVVIGEDDQMVAGQGRHAFRRPPVAEHRGRQQPGVDSKLASAAQKALAPVAASTRIVPASHLWKHLPGEPKPALHDDVQDWIKLGGYPKALIDICRKIPADGTITAEPYQFREQADIAPWQWLYGRHLLRGEVSGTAAMGGTGKSTLSIVEALAMASGRALLCETSSAPLRVVLINLEDTRNTMDKRIAAVMHQHSLTPADIGDRLIVIAKGEIKIKVARQLRSGDVERNEPIIQALTKLMIEHRADVLSVDSFIRTHRVNENDNSAVQEVVECFEDIAAEAQCAVHLWHHTRKAGGERATMETARGAIAFVDACRSARVLETMSAKEHAQLLEVQPEMMPAGFYFRAFNGKRNFAPPADQSDWFKLESVVLLNGDDVGVVTAWQYPETWEDLSPELTALVLDDIDRGMPDGQRYSNHNRATRRQAWPVVRKRCPTKTQNQCRQIISTWIKKGLLHEDEYYDSAHRKSQSGLFVRKPTAEEAKP